MDAPLEHGEIKKNMIKKLFVLLFVTVVLGFNLSAESITDLFVAEETAIDYFPASNYVCINEYNLLYAGNKSSIGKDMENIKELIQSAKYSEEKFGINDFFAVEESLSNNRKYLRGKYDLLTSENATFEMIEEIFSKVLKRKVSVFSDGTYINVTFDGSGIKIRSYDAEIAYSKGNQIIMKWSNRLSRMEIVFGTDVTNFQPIFEYVDDKITSPEKTQEEVDYLRYGLPELTGLEKELQDDCDIVRLKHLKYYGDLIEEYKIKTGHYPFQENSQTQIYSLIYNSKQKKYAADTNPNNHILISPKDFFAELEKGLDRKIDQMYDPQYAPTCRPIFYMYMIQGDTYYFAVHLSKYYPFSKRVDRNYYKVEISNKSEPSYKFYTIKELSENNKYIEAVSIPPKKEGYFLLIYYCEKNLLFPKFNKRLS